MFQPFLCAVKSLIVTAFSPTVMRSFSEPCRRFHLCRSTVAIAVLVGMMPCVPSAHAQAIPPSLVGITEWTGTVTQSPPAPGFTSGTWNVTMFMAANAGGQGTVTNSFMQSQSQPQYWIFSTGGGNISGGVFTFTGSAHTWSLPFGDFPCGSAATQTANITATTITQSGPASGNGTCATTSATSVLNNISGRNLGCLPCGWQAMLAKSQIKNANEPTNGASLSTVGDPIDISTGNVYEVVTDYTTSGPNPLAFTRYYNSFNPLLANATAFSVPHWRHNYDRYLQLGLSQVVAERPDGRQIIFTLSGGVWTPPTGVDMSLTRTSTAWILTDHDDTVETYPTFFNPILPEAEILLVAQSVPVATITYRGGYSQAVAYNSIGQPTTVTDSYGRQLAFAYTNGQLATVTTPDSLVLTYAYDSSGAAPGVTDRLVSVSYNTTPPGSVTYQYGNAAFPFAITAVIDENGNAQSSFTYDGFGRALTSKRAGGADAFTITYNDTAGSRTVVNALGNQDTYAFLAFNGIQHLTQIGRVLPNTTINRFFTYDANGYLATATNWNGIKIAFTNNAHGDPATIVEASGTTLARTTTITYDSAFVHLPASVATPALTTSLTYDTAGNLLTKTLTDTTTTTVPYSTNGLIRIWTYTWNNFLPASITSPAGNVTSFTFDATGALTAVTNALNQTTSVTAHTGGGLPLTVVDPNGVTTMLAYDGRNRLTSKTLQTATGPLQTLFAYDPAGNLISATQPDGSRITNSYDAANRVTKASDLFGNSVNFTLDGLGDTTRVSIQNQAGTATRTVTATYDKLGRPTANVNGAGWTRQFGWDNNGNNTVWTDFFQPAAGGPSAHTYSNDALNRATLEQFAVNTTFTWDVHDRPLTVTDANGGVTSNVYDGFGETIQQNSPDSGITVYRYDADGNLISKTDALNVTANYGYDALDRITSVSYPAGPAGNIAYAYDEAAPGFGIGHLTSLTDAAGSLTRSYDERGNLVTETRITGNGSHTTSYSYDSASRLSSITYPSGSIVSYVRDAMGRVISVGATPLGGTATMLANNIAYKPFGPWTNLTYGNGIAETVGYDGDYSVTSVLDAGTATVQNVSYIYGSGVRGEQYQVTFTRDNFVSANSLNMSYDGKLRILSAGGSGATGSTTAYDANDNRTGYSGSAPVSFAYTAHTNRLASYTVGSGTTAVTTTVTTDARGSVTAFSTGLISITGSAISTGPITALSYNNAGQLASASGLPGTLGVYIYDAFGNRFSKTVCSPSPAICNMQLATTFTYAPDGTLLEEVAPAGAARDYVYLNGRPLAMLDNGATSSFTYLHDDLLGTPQVATNQSQAVVWHSTLLPYGTPISVTGTTTVNLRRPGQYFDAETGLFSNGFRTYAPQLARYLQSDPIGLTGGWNTYSYVSARPMAFVDPSGLCGYDPAYKERCAKWRAGILALQKNMLRRQAAIMNNGLNGPAKPWSTPEDIQYPGQSVQGHYNLIDGDRAKIDEYRRLIGLYCPPEDDDSGGGTPITIKTPTTTIGSVTTIIVGTLGTISILVLAF